MTPFGRYMRDLRISRGILLKTLAEQLGVTSAYLSALEHGKKGMPNAAFVQKIVSALALDPKASEQLKKVVSDSETEFTIPPKATPFAFEVANAFARHLPNLSDRQLSLIREILDE